MAFLTHLILLDLKTWRVFEAGEPRGQFCANISDMIIEPYLLPADFAW